MPATIPSGSRELEARTPRAIGPNVVPRSRSGIPCDSSRDSRPRRKEAAAASRGFPCSRTMPSTSPGLDRFQGRLRAAQYHHPPDNGVWAQAGWAFRAAATARSTSDAAESGTSARSSPVEGSTTGRSAGGLGFMPETPEEVAQASRRGSGSRHLGTTIGVPSISSPPVGGTARGTPPKSRYRDMGQSGPPGASSPGKVSGGGGGGSGD